MSVHYVVSDLHLNMGRREDGSLHPLEDFDSHDAFDGLIDRALRERAEVILNGDWLDFLQLEPYLPIGSFRSLDGVPLSYTCEDALEKLETCLRTQARHFETLRRFLSDGGRLVVVQGNHDADLFFPSAAPQAVPPLQARIRQALGAPDAIVLRFVEHSLRVGSVHVEHGHQRCEVLNAFGGHPAIFHADRQSPLTGRLRMELLWGSRLVVEFFNDLEQAHPFADNLKPTTRAVWLGVRNGWLGANAAARFLGFLWSTGLPATAVVEVLGEEPDAMDMVQRLPDEDLRDLFLRRMGEDPVFAQELQAEVEALTRDAPKRVDVSRAALGREEIVGLDDDQTLGLVRLRRELREARALLGEPGVEAVVFGHTHQELDGAAPGAEVPNYFNTGTWTPRLDLRRTDVRALLASETFDLSMLNDRSLFELRLMYARIEQSQQATTVALEEWTG